MSTGPNATVNNEPDNSVATQDANTVSIYLY